MDYYKNQTYYDVLGVKETASFEQISRAKDRLKFGNSDDRAPFSMWDKIDEAYNVLSNYKSRSEYDKKLQEQKDSYIDASELISDRNVVRKKEISDEKDLIDNQKELEQPELLSNIDQNIDENLDQIPLEEDYLDYVSEFQEQQEPKKTNSKSKTFGKYVAGTLIGFAVLGPLGAVAVPIWMKKHKRKIKLQKEKKPKRIIKLTNEEMKEFEIYNQKLDESINRLLSEPHNNYKLRINKIKYENQIELLSKLLEIKLNKKVEKKNLLKHKLDIVATKMQIETSKNNLNSVMEKIDNQNTKQRLSQINSELITVNKQLLERKNEKSYSIQKLKVYQSRLLNKRDKKAKRIKTRVIKSGNFYDKILKAKDFVVSLPYLIRKEEHIDQFIESPINRVR